jgi:hypothetical protein
MPNTPAKPAFSIVSPETTGRAPGRDPPRPLGEPGRALWDRVQGEYGIEDIGGIELLAAACSTLDRAEELSAIIADDGAVIRSDSGVPRAHPAVKDELACRAFVVRTLERLGLNIEAVKPVGRPPRPSGWTP